MKFKFTIQQYQTDAVNSVVNVFKGQPKQGGVSYRRVVGKEYEVKLSDSEVIDNRRL